MATTAQKLIAYRRELQAGGFDPDLVADLVKDAAQTLVMHNGLHVHTSADSTPPAVPSKPLPPRS